MEFKLDGTAEEALAKIEDKHYALPFEMNGQKIIRLGIPDEFVEQGTCRELYELCGIDAGSIARIIADTQQK